MKRTKFYVNADVWGKGLDSSDVAVYAFLSWCANAEGESFPAMSTMSRELNRGETSIRRSLQRLEEKGLLIKVSRYSYTGNGCRTQLSNLYRLVEGVAETEPEGRQNDPKRGSVSDTHINNNININYNSHRAGRTPSEEGSYPAGNEYKKSASGAYGAPNAFDKYEAAPAAANGGAQYNKPYKSAADERAFEVKNAWASRLIRADRRVHEQALEEERRRKEENAAKVKLLSDKLTGGRDMTEEEKKAELLKVLVAGNFTPECVLALADRP